MFSKALCITLLTLSLTLSAQGAPAELEVRKNNDNGKNAPVCSPVTVTVRATSPVATKSAPSAVTSPAPTVVSGGTKNPGTGAGAGNGNGNGDGNNNASGNGNGNGNNNPSGNGNGNNNPSGNGNGNGNPSGNGNGNGNVNPPGNGNGNGDNGGDDDGSPAGTGSGDNAGAGGAGGAGAGAGTDDGDLQTSLTLDPSVIAKGFANDGQDVPTDGQVRSLTSVNNFINFCLTRPDLPITDGKQIKTGSCNPAPIGLIPSTDNMPSGKFVFPSNGDTSIQPNTAFTIQLKIKNMETGSFVNAQENYFGAPQQLNQGGQIIGHSHVVVEALTSLDQTEPTDPRVFAFFKGLNAKADGQGILTASVDKGLPAGFYRLSSINAASNHQPVIVPIAQHGALDDWVYFSIGEGDAADPTGTDPTESSSEPAPTATSTADDGPATTSTADDGPATTSTADDGAPTTSATDDGASTTSTVDDGASATSTDAATATGINPPVLTGASSTTETSSAATLIATGATTTTSSAAASTSSSAAAGGGGKGGADFGSCSIPSIIFGSGLGGKKGTVFQPADLSSFGTTPAEEIDGVINFICGKLSSDCKANNFAKTLCATAAKAAKGAPSTSGKAADMFNGVFGHKTAFSNIQPKPAKN